jgi:hypothetical protein
MVRTWVLSPLRVAPDPTAAAPRRHDQTSIEQSRTRAPLVGRPISGASRSRPAAVVVTRGASFTKKSAPFHQARNENTSTLPNIRDTSINSTPPPVARPPATPSSLLPTPRALLRQELDMFGGDDNDDLVSPAHHETRQSKPTPPRAAANGQDYRGYEDLPPAARPEAVPLGSKPREEDDHHDSVPTAPVDPPMPKAVPVRSHSSKPSARPLGLPAGQGYPPREEDDNHVNRPMPKAVPIRSHSSKLSARPIGLAAPNKGRRVAQENQLPLHATDEQVSKEWIRQQYEMFKHWLNFSTWRIFTEHRCAPGRRPVLKHQPCNASVKKFRRKFAEENWRCGPTMTCRQIWTGVKKLPICSCPMRPPGCDWAWKCSLTSPFGHRSPTAPPMQYVLALSATLSPTPVYSLIFSCSLAYHESTPAIHCQAGLVGRKN